MLLKAHILPSILFLLLNANVDRLKVNTFEDIHNPPTGVVTLRSALNHAGNDGVITFDEHLDGGVIKLSEVGQEQTQVRDDCGYEGSEVPDRPSLPQDRGREAG